MRFEDDAGFTAVADEENGDEKLLTRFSVRAKHDEVASKEAGRPIYHDAEYVEVKSPEDPWNIPCFEVTESIKRRFASRYERWKSADTVARQSGLPLSEFAGLTRSAVEELRHYKIGTVEQLAAASDKQLNSEIPLLAYRQKARDHLAAATSSAPAEKLHSELSEKDARIAQLERMMAERDAAMAMLQKRERARAAP